MNMFLQQIINQKINDLTVEELIHYAKKYKIYINAQQASAVIQILRSEKIDINDKKQHQRIIQKIEQKVGPKISSQMKDLLNQFSSYL